MKTLDGVSSLLAFGIGALSVLALAGVCFPRSLFLAGNLWGLLCIVGLAIAVLLARRCRLPELAPEETASAQQWAAFAVSLLALHAYCCAVFLSLAILFVRTAYEFRLW